MASPCPVTLDSRTSPIALPAQVSTDGTARNARHAPSSRYSAIPLVAVVRTRSTLPHGSPPMGQSILISGAGSPSLPTWV